MRILRRASLYIASLGARLWRALTGGMHTKAMLAVAGAAFAALLSSLVLAGSAGATGATLTIPAGDSATLSGAYFGDESVTGCPTDSLVYGYTLTGGSEVQVSTNAPGSCGSAVGATIAAVDTARTLPIDLTDANCSTTYTSDGDHGLVTEESASTWGVSIMDCDNGSGTGSLRISSPG